MKYLLVLMLLITTYSVNAESYITVYGSTTLATTSYNKNEINSINNNVIFLLGKRIGTNSGVVSEFFLNGSGFGATVGGFIKSNNSIFSTGFLMSPDVSSGKLIDADYNDSSNSMGFGAYVNYSYKVLSIRLARYTVDHAYVSKKIIGYKHSIPVFEKGLTKDKVTRDVLWVGVNIPF